MGADLSLANHKPAICSVPPDTEILTSSPRQTKRPDNSNTLNMFDNKIYTDFKTTYKYMLILWWCCAQELFRSQIPVTTGGFNC